MKRFICSIVFIVSAILSFAQKPLFKVIAFYTAKNDLAHISFAHEANRWFPSVAKQYNFIYDSTDNWDNLNPSFLSQYKVVYVTLFNILHIYKHPRLCIPDPKLL